VSIQKNIAYLVDDNLVKVGNSLFPVTHRFVVQPTDWVFEGAILECYNCAMYLRPGNVREMNQAGGHKFEITFAHTRLTGGAFSFTPPHYIWKLNGRVI